MFRDYTEITAYVTNSISTGVMFAMNVDNSDEQVFISSHVASRHKLCDGAVARLRVVPNNRPNAAKWFCIGVNEDATPMRDVEPEPTREAEPAASSVDSVDWYAKAKAAVAHLGACTTNEVAEHLNCNPNNIGTYLRNLHDRGEICRAGLRSSGGQTRDSLVFWAINLSDLEPAEFED